MFAIEVTDSLQKLFIPWQTIWGIVIFFNGKLQEIFFSLTNSLQEYFFSSKNLCLRKLWCMELEFLTFLIVFIHEFCNKMSNRKIMIQMNTIDSCLLDYGMQQNEGVMENVIVHVLNARNLRGEEYWSQQPQNITGNMDMLRGGINIIQL